MGRPPKVKRTKSAKAKAEQPTAAQAALAALLASGTALVVREEFGGPMQRAVCTKEGLAAIAAMAAEGQDQVSMAAALGMNKSTLANLIKRDPAVEEALQVGKAALSDELTHLLLRGAREGNVVCAIYLTKARLGWREGDAPDVKPNIIINLPDAQTPEAYLRMLDVTPPKDNQP